MDHRAPPSEPPAARARAISRSTDRRITAAGLGVAGAFLALAAIAAILPPVVRRGAWLPLHLVLAGAAGTAIAAVMPFFTAALAAAPPANPRLRATAIGLLAAGALAVTTGWAGGLDPLAALGGATYLAGLLALATAAAAPLRRGLGPRGGIVAIAYGVGIVDVLVGVAIATAFVGGDRAVAADWAALKPAHAWLNLLGFVSLAIAGTLLHLLPTVLGTRIRRGRSGYLTIGGLALGAPIVAAGFVAGSAVVIRIGAAAAGAGACGLIGYTAACIRDRGRWTTDPGWHRFAIGSLVAAVGWFALAIALAAGRVLVLGATPAAWTLAPIAAPLAVGWAGQSILGASSHLLPAVGPGDMARHAAQRRLLGRAALARLGGLQLGTALLTIGMAGGSALVSAAGAVVTIVTVGAGLALATAAWVGTAPLARTRAASR